MRMVNSDRAGAGLAAAAGIAVLAFGAGARADCTPPTHQSTCFDADTFAAPYAPADFLTISRARALPARTFALGLDVTELHRPIVVLAPSPDPNGRDLHPIDDAVDATVALAAAPASHLELGVALPLSVYRRGSGLSGITSQGGEDVGGSAVRDLRLGAGYDVWRTAFDEGRSEAAVLVRLDLTLPTGAKGSFAGERSIVTAPGIDVEVRHGRFFAAAEERVRLREPLEFAGDRLGTQFVSSLGVGADVLDHGALALTVEAYVAPYLSSSSRTLADRTRVDLDPLIPSEWLLSVRSRVDEFTLGLGGGTAIPLSSESRIDATGVKTSSTYAAVTSPEFRVVLTLRRTFGASRKP